MSTVHNPVNFDPSQYRCVGFFDNQPPELHPPFGGFNSPEEHERFISTAKRMREEWLADGLALFPDKNWNRCQHCGQGRVRYVVSAEHIPTGKRICFGDICCQRLDIKDFDSFQSKRLRELAAARLESQKHARQALAYLDSHPDVNDALKAIVAKGDAAPAFAQDLVRKFRKYATMSDKQAAWLIKLADPNYVDPRQAAIERRRAENAKSQYVGKVGERRQFKVKIVKVVSFEASFRRNYYDDGMRYITIMKEGDNVVIYFGDHSLGDEGKELTLKATIKEHGEREGTKQTIVARPFLK